MKFVCDLCVDCLVVMDYGLHGFLLVLAEDELLSQKLDCLLVLSKGKLKMLLNTTTHTIFLTFWVRMAFSSRSALI